MKTPVDSLERFDAALAAGEETLLGVDEVGRGCLAGPVVAAAVALPRGCTLSVCADSKTLRPEERRSAALEIRARALAIGLSFVGPREIERSNIRTASLLAMHRAVRRARARLVAVASSAAIAQLSILVLVDGNTAIPGLETPQRPLVKADARSQSVAAASIVAKVARDGLMQRVAADFPLYGFDLHMGYGTRAHLEALARFGPCTWHRHTFAPVAQPSFL